MSEYMTGSRLIKDYPRDVEILEQRQRDWDKVAGPRVGDFIKMGDGTVRRFTHTWDDGIQTTIKGNVDASFYFGRGGYMSFSGSLDRTISNVCISLGWDETMEGSCWFFHEDWVRAHHGVYGYAKCRVYRYINPNRPTGEWAKDKPEMMSALDNAPRFVSGLQDAPKQGAPVIDEPK